MSFESLDLRSLADLLRQTDPDYQEPDDSDDEKDTYSTPSKTFGPGHIGPIKKEKGGGDADKKRKEDKKSIWSSTDVNKVAENKVQAPVTEDPRKTPKYEMHYRQSVTTEDVFLQMGNKTPSSVSCENLVVEVHLPGEDDVNKIQLNLKEQAIDLRSPNYFLYLGLPHPIDAKAGHAKWDKDKEKLIVTLKLARELDPLNF